MENLTSIEFEKLKTLRTQLEELQRVIEDQTQVLIQSTSNDFTNEIENLKVAINNSFKKPKLIPIPFGFLVSTSDFKKLGGKTNIRRKIQETAGISNYVNMIDTEYYYESHIPKEIKITLTKGFIQKINKSYKNILSDIDITQRC